MRGLGVKKNQVSPLDLIMETNVELHICILNILVFCDLWDESVWTFPNFRLKLHLDAI